MSTKNRVEQFLENKESYKVKSRNTFKGGDQTPEDQGSDLSNDAIGGFIYNFIANGYATDDTKGNYQDLGYETPAEFNDFLTKGVGNEGANTYNNYVDTVAAALERAFDSSGFARGTVAGRTCAIANENYANVESGMPNPETLNFCTGEVTDEQLKFFLQKEAERALENTLYTKSRFDAAGVNGINDKSNEYQSDDFNSAENKEKRDESRHNALDASEAIAEDAFNASVYGRIDPRYQEQCFLLTHALTFAKIKIDMDENGWYNEEGKRVYNKTYPYYGEDAGGSLAGSNSSILSHYDPFAFINRLTQSGAKSYFFDATSSELSALQPMIRLYKVIAEQQEDGSTIEREVEINFDSYATQNDLSKLENKANRGFGAGIKSFDFKCNASNPFAIKKSISAKLVIFANNFGELYRDRDGTAVSTNNNGDILYSNVKYKYLDLALKTGDEDTFDYQRGGVDPRDANAAIYDDTKLNFRLKAVVGWANPKATNDESNGVGTSTISSGMLNAIYDSYITLNLTPTIHDFDIDELGRVTFSLNYLAYVEDFFDQPEYNIFTDLEPTISQVSRRIKQAEANQKCDPATVAQTKGNETEIKQIEQEKQENLHSLIRSMVDRNKIRVFDIDIEELGRYKNAGPLIELDSEQVEEFRKKITTGTLEDVPEAVDPTPTTKSQPYMGTYVTYVPTGLATPPAPPKASFGNVPFFYVSDLIDIILRNQSILFVKLPDALKNLSGIDSDLLNEQVLRYQRHQENFRRFRILLGPLELVKATKIKIPGEQDPPAQIETAVVNLGDLPISTKYFMEFMTEKMLKTDREVYPIGSFLNDFFNTFISDFLNTDNCFGGRTSQKVRLFQSAITGFNDYTQGDEYPDDMVYYMVNNNRRRVNLYDSNIPRPALDVMGGRGQSTQTGEMADEINYLIYYAGRVQPMDTLLGDRGDDQERGIFHYQIGKDSGIVKNINLSKTNSPGLAEVRFEQEGYDGLQQLLVLYDANIKSFLDVTAFPGSYIYIEPRGFDPGLTDPKRFTNLGIGGYYMITETDHSLGAGTAETSITAKWVAQVNNENPTDGGATEVDPCTQVKNSRKEKATGFDGFVSSIFGVPLGTDEGGA